MPAASSRLFAQPSRPFALVAGVWVGHLCITRFRPELE
ncbi:hypothetical protein Hsw_2338 [Hymenobacter swuensis DY53]|uniref:Uncharacterized protein n=1 Tax=Hymenobacter swuensis DY53 TaxID=1227739 RepID=W8EZ92_9BACT|nr:hypothetical protein Hsw_2338 [Hymenobacter swuensis DY53]